MNSKTIRSDDVLYSLARSACYTPLYRQMLSKLDGSVPANPMYDRRVANAVMLKSTFRLP